MLVTFKNTGMVEEAGIRPDGLIVIAGENDTGIFFGLSPFLHHQEEMKRAAGE